MGSWTLELIVRRVFTQRQTGGGDHEPDPYAYLKDVLTRLPAQRVSKIVELLPHNWALV